MMKRLWAVVLVLLCSSCGAKHVPLNPTGVRAKISLVDREIPDAELIALNDGILYFLADTVSASEQAAIDRIELQFHEYRPWVFPVLLFQGLPSVLLLLHDDKRAGVMGLAVTSVTWLTFEYSQPELDFGEPWNEEDLRTLRQHMRYPQGLSEEQMENLRNFYRRNGD